MRVTRFATARAHRQPPGQLRLGRGRERRGLLIADMHPLNTLSAANHIYHRVQAVTHNAINTLHPSLAKHVD
jgi:hypothetical protein